MLSDGSYLIRAVARDGAQNIGEDTLAIRITSSLPTPGTTYYACDCRPGAFADCVAGNDSDPGISPTAPVASGAAIGTLLNATITLGYDVHHDRIEPLLIEAALATDLENPTVQIRALHDHAVEYWVAGFTADTKKLLTRRSQLHRNVLDSLHEAGVEIVSPNFMVQRPQPDGIKKIPRRSRTKAEQREGVVLEDIAFDKAAAAEQLETMGGEIEAIREEIKEWKGRLSGTKGEDAERIQRRITAKEKRIERIKKLLDAKHDAPA